ncbi:MAG: Gfo/Idh/MocA family oxidoreductase [Deltaproteobacteria bacterium]|nr:Gfo/Idh/MocA family oxidoreductase [Deltaproteobacteria bacterium]
MSGKEPVNVAVLGAGYWGRNYVRNLSGLPEARLSWVCDLDPRARERAATVAPEAQVTADFTQMLSDPAVQAVVIATNAAHHHGHGLAALRAGKHVLVEKPMATSVRDAEELVRASEEYERILMVGHLMLYHPAVERLRAMVQGGELGKIHYLYALRVNLGQIRSDENALWSFGPHDLSIIRYLLGAEPESISARGQAYLRAGVEDVVFVNVAFRDHTMAQIQLSWLDPHKERRLTVVGSRKMVVFDDVHPTEKLRLFDKGFDRPPEYDSYGDYLSLRNGDIHIPRVAMTEPLTAECRHFLQAVSDGTSVRSPGHEGLEVVRLLEAAQQSLEAGGVPVRFS